MSHWTDYASAPDVGTRVAKLSDLTPGANSLKIETAKGSFPLIVVLKNKHATGFVNACPHQYLPLDYRSSNILSSDGHKLMCSAHGAMFDISSGEGLNDIVQGCQLNVVPLEMEPDGSISITSDYRTYLKHHP